MYRHKEKEMWKEFSCRMYVYFLILILSLHPANERRRYKATPPFIDWAQA